jgi:hypothetical protein
MALVKNGTGEYARVLVKDTAEFGLSSKVFIVETWKDSATRNNPGEYDKAKYRKYRLDDNWSASVTGSMTLDEISIEAYRCLKLTDDFSSGWTDDA